MFNVIFYIFMGDDIVRFPRKNAIIAGEGR